MTLKLARTITNPIVQIPDRKLNGSKVTVAIDYMNVLTGMLREWPLDAPLSGDKTLTYHYYRKQNTNTTLSIFMNA
jgi:hypothetical protein